MNTGEPLDLKRLEVKQTTFEKNDKASSKVTFVTVAGGIYDTAVENLLPHNPDADRCELASQAVSRCLSDSLLSEQVGISA